MSAIALERSDEIRRRMPVGAYSHFRRKYGTSRAPMSVASKLSGMPHGPHAGPRTKARSRSPATLRPAQSGLERREDVPAASFVLSRYGHTFAAHTAGIS